MNDEYYFFKSFLNEWVIGKMLEHDEDSGEFILDKPRIVVLEPIPGNQMQAHYVPYDITNPNKPVRFHPDYVGAQAIEIADFIVENYIMSTTDIQIASQLPN